MCVLAGRRRAILPFSPKVRALAQQTGDPESSSPLPKGDFESVSQQSALTTSEELDSP